MDKDLSIGLILGGLIGLGASLLFLDAELKDENVEAKTEENGK